MSENNNNNNLIEEVNQKEIGNAISGYLMIFFSALLLLNKSKHINTPFVRGHIKSAMLIHFGFLLTYIIFISFSLFSKISIFGLGVNHIITILLSMGLLGLLIMGIYKAKNGLSFTVSKGISIYKQKSILDIDGDGEITEKEKLTIIFSFVPFIGFLIFGKYKNHPTIKNSTRVNIVITLIISLLFIFGNGSLSSLILLVYIVIITFIGINLFTRDELLQIKLPKVFSPENTYIGFITLKNYLLGYLKPDSFKSFSETYITTNEKIKKSEEALLLELKEKKDFKLPKVILYIPILNLISLFSRKTNYSAHKINGITLTILIIIGLILSYFGYLTYKINILLLFPILFGIGYLDNRLAYRVPVIYDLYLIFIKFFNLIGFGTKKINEKRKEEKEVSLKVGEANEREKENQIKE